MTDPTRSSIRFRAVGLLSLLGFAVLWSCGREVTGPGGAVVRLVRGLSFNTVFPTAYQQAAGAGLVSFTKVRVVLHHSDGSVALDTLVDFPSTATELTLTLAVPLLANAPVGGEPMTLDLAYINAAGVTVFKGGPVAITAVPTGVGGPAPPPPVSVPVAYTGPGANAAAVRIAAPKTRALLIGDAFSFTANAVDGSGNPIPGTPIVWASADPTVASMSPGGAGTAVARGTARIVAQLLTGQTDTARVTVTAQPQSISAQSGSGQSAVINSPLAAPLVARVLGTDNLPLGGVAVTFAVTAGGGSVGTASTIADANGLAQTTWRLGAAVGAQSVTATVAGVAAPATFAATATLPVPAKLAFTTQPVTGLIGAVVVQAQDNFGNLATSFTGPVTVTLGGGTASATLAGTATVNAVAGVATFTGLSVSTPGTGYTLTATASLLTSATSNAFDITAGPAAKLRFTQSPVNGTIDGVLTPAPVVAAQDAAGNLATSFTGSITLAVTGGAGRLVGSTSVNAVAGVATFPGLAVNLAGKGYVLVASATGLTSGSSSAFDIGVGVPTALAILSGSEQTGATSSALAQPVIVRVADAAGDPVPNEAVTFTAANGGSASPVTATTDTLGRAQSIWTLGAATGAQSLTIAGPRLTAFAKAATATAVTAASTPTQLVVATQPGATYTAGASIAPAITVEARDASNLLVTSFTGSVSLAIGANPGTSTLTGTPTANAVAGVATFSGLSLNKSGAGYTLVASSSGLTSATTTAFAITAGAATSIVITAGNFQTAAVSTVLPNPVVVQTVDAYGNGVAAKTVNFAVTAGGGSVSPASATTNATGNAQTTWTLGASVSPQTLSITSTGLTGSPLTATANSGAATIASTVVTPHLDTLTAIGATFGLAAQAKDANNANLAGTFA